MMECLLDDLRRLGSPGVHLGMSALNKGARRFYERLGFAELCRVGSDAEGVVYMGRTLAHSGVPPAPARR